jgi:hypothetical protein
MAEMGCSLIPFAAFPRLRTGRNWLCMGEEAIMTMERHRDKSV